MTVGTIEYNRQAMSKEIRKVFDDYAYAITTISEPHRMIHDGFFFSMSGIETALANLGTFDILFRAPAGQMGHVTLLEFTVQNAPITVTMYEGTTTSADGTPTNARNHNRVNGNDTPGIATTTQPTVTGLGTLLDERYVPDIGGPPGVSHGLLVAGADAEWVLGSPDVETTYLWRLTNNSGGAIDLGYHFNGYQLGYPGKDKNLSQV